MQQAIAPPLISALPCGLSAIPRSWWLGFFALALDLVAAGIGLRTDQVGVPILLWAHRSPAVPEIVWASLTLLGSAWAVVIPIAALDRSHGAYAALAVVSVALGGIVVNFFKATWQQPRPSLVLEPGQLVLIGEWTANSASMPSGHAAGAGVLFMLVIIVLRAQNRLTVGRCVAMGLFTAAIMWSRVAVGAHWPADILVGAGFGVITAIVCALGSGEAVRSFGRRWMPSSACCRLAVGTAEMFLAFICLTAETGQPSAFYLQILLACVAIGSSGLRFRSIVLPKSAPPKSLPGSRVEASFES